MNWELVEVTNNSCDECGKPAACNVYRAPFGCVCLNCVERKKNIYIYAFICGDCMGKWLKTRNQFED